jgi:hypothetical protein
MSIKEKLKNILNTRHESLMMRYKKKIQNLACPGDYAIRICLYFDMTAAMD